MTVVTSTTPIQTKVIMSNIQTLQWLIGIASTGIVVTLALSFVFGGSNIFLNRLMTQAKEEQHTYERQEYEKTIASLYAESNKAREGIALAQAEAAKANEKAEAERLTRIKLEEALMPRILVTSGRTDEELKLFAGTKVFLFFRENDPDARDLASQIQIMLERNRWNIISITERPTDPYLTDGVQLRTRRIQHMIGPEVFDAPPYPAAQLLSYQLLDSKIKTTLWSPRYDFWPEDVHNDAIFVAVGKKPISYFMNKITEDFLSKYDSNIIQIFQDSQRRIEEIEKHDFEYPEEKRRKIVERQKQLLQR
jgi:outer membrane murein-binding lipoprotein Lpp